MSDPTQDTVTSPSKVLDPKSVNVLNASRITQQNSLQNNSSLLAPLAIAGQSNFTPATTPTLKIVAPASGSQFFINNVPQMPQIDLEVQILGITPDPTSKKRFDWSVDITFNAANSSSYGKSGVVFKDGFIINNVLGGQLNVTFPWFRGGDLTIAVRTYVASTLVEAVFRGRIIGTNPNWAEISTALGNDLLRKIAKHESGGQQFETDTDASKGIVPVFNRGRDGGAGILQVTPPTAEDIWNWRTNIENGKRIFAAKQAAARNYPSAVANSTRFKTLVNDFNVLRQQQGKSALTIRVPPYSPSQLERDTLRGYNGYAGTDSFGNGLHEYRIVVENGILRAENINESALTGDAVWEQVPVNERPQVGNPNYVDNVLNTGI